MPASQTPKSSWWPTIFAILLLIIIAVLAAFSYQSYAHNVELAAENSSLLSQTQTLTADKTALQSQVNDTTKRLTELECDGIWNGESCAPYPAFITNKVSSGAAPLAVSFTVKTKSPKYSMDFGDGSTTPLTTGTNACVPKDDGFCLFTVAHTYRVISESDTVYTVKLMQKDAVATSTSITVTGKK